jgi:hypothetical protein
MNAVSADGAAIPVIGLGTMTLMDSVCVEAVKAALQRTSIPQNAAATRPDKDMGNSTNLALPFNRDALQ